jgi:hypothetical protein
VPLPGQRRVAARVVCSVAAILGVGALAGCGTPAHLDTQEQVAFARECASLVERNVSEATPPRRATLGGETLTLSSASSFYSILQRIRGSSTYNLHDPKHDADTARQPLDDCNPKPPVLSSLLDPKSSSTTTSATTTTVPGS